LLLLRLTVKNLICFIGEAADVDVVGLAAAEAAAGELLNDRG